MWSSSRQAEHTTPHRQHVCTQALLFNHRETRQRKEGAVSSEQGWFDLDQLVFGCRGVFTGCHHLERMLSGDTNWSSAPDGCHKGRRPEKAARGAAFSQSLSVSRWGHRELKMRAQKISKVISRA